HISYTKTILKVINLEYPNQLSFLKENLSQLEREVLSLKDSDFTDNLSSQWHKIKKVLKPYEDSNFHFYNKQLSLYIDNQNLPEIIGVHTHFNSGKFGIELKADENNFNLITDKIFNSKSIYYIESNVSFTIYFNEIFDYTNLTLVFEINKNSNISLNVILGTNNKLSFHQSAELVEKINPFITKNFNIPQFDLSQNQSIDLYIKYIRISEEINVTIKSFIQEIIKTEKTIDLNKKENKIRRSVHFSEEQCQAGIGILSYFGKVLKDKHPNLTNSVSIHQDGNIVRLEIECEDGTKEIIEKTLDDYSLVLTNQAEPENLLSDQFQVMRLNNKLEIAAMEVRQTKDLLALAKDYNIREVLSLKEEIAFLRTNFGQLHSTNSQLVLGCVNQFDKLINLADGKQDVIQAIQFIEDKLNSSINDTDIEKLKKSIELIQRNSPQSIDSLKELATNSMYGVSGNILFGLLTQAATLVFS
ncbi:hypothetical protein L4D77_25310, partial [Photobacterium frigidiphilum]